MAIIPKIEYETKLQERLTVPTVWKEVCKVDYTDTGIMRNPYLTDAVVGTGTRGTGYTSTAAETTDDTVTISDYKYCAQHIDRADLAQKTFKDWMEMADNMGTMLNLALETAMLAAHASYTNFGTASIGGGGSTSDPITVDTSNVDDIIIEMKTAIRTAGGGTMADTNGMFIQWREADFAKVERLAASQGYNTADDALKNGIKQGFKYLGVEHYSSSLHAAGHVVGGVKKAIHLGICKSTYGLMTEIMNPVVSSAQISGVGLESRIDYKYNVWSKMAPIIFDINVA